MKIGPKRVSKLEKAIDDVLDEMGVLNADSDEYAKMVDHLVKLHELKENETPKRVSHDTLVTIGGNILVVGIIIAHERAHVITTKALQFVAKT